MSTIPAFTVPENLYRHPPRHHAFIDILKACAASRDVHLGRQLHALAAKSGLHGRYAAVVHNSILDMYCKCGRRDDGIRVFRGIEEKSVISWNMVLNCGDLAWARKVFDEMPVRDVVSWNILMSCCVREGRLDVAQEVFDEMPVRDVASWNVLIGGYSRKGDSERALGLFSRMVEAGVRPDSATLLSVVSACYGDCVVDENVVDRVIGFLRSSVRKVSVSTALLTLYGKVGRVDEARDVFDSIHEKDTIAWNAMISVYAKNDMPFEAIELFRLMQRSEDGKIKPDIVTLIGLVDSCSQIGMLSLARWVHAYISKSRIEPNVVLTTALIGMYSRCGDLNQSRRLFYNMRKRDLAAWNAMIKGLAIHGYGKEALEVFNLMTTKDAVVPNEVTFVALLAACSHGGLVDEGLELFKLMHDKYGCVPDIKHYGCVVDLLGRAGKLSEAYDFVKNMPIEPDAIVWNALLGASRCQQNVEIAEEAAKRLVELGPLIDSNYVLLSNLYASKRKWTEVTNLRGTMRAHGVNKEPGCSAVELDGVLHEFSSGDRSHPDSENIYEALDDLVKRLRVIGYEPDSSVLVRNLDEEEKEEAVYRHSEKLALAFALINTEAKSPVRIIKNLRICNDCHRAMELASELEQREIVIRDRIRFHHFVEGQCSCGGYW